MYDKKIPKKIPQEMVRQQQSQKVRGNKKKGTRHQGSVPGIQVEKKMRAV